MTYRGLIIGSLAAGCLSLVGFGIEGIVRFLSGGMCATCEIEMERKGTVSSILPTRGYLPIIIRWTNVGRKSLVVPTITTQEAKDEAHLKTMDWFG